MVEVKELRIGNFVYLPSLSKAAYEYENVPFCVEELFTEDGGYKVLCHCETKEGYNCTEDAIISEIEPIPLTADLLLKCGFEWDKGHKAFRRESFCPLICKNDGTDYWRIDTSKEGYHQKYDNKLYLTSEKEYTVSYKPIEYLHQLQNIYYALTGKELEVDL